MGRIAAILADVLALARAGVELRDVLRRIGRPRPTDHGAGPEHDHRPAGPGVAELEQPAGAEAPQPTRPGDA